MALKLKAPFIPLQFVLQKTVPAVSISLRWKNCSGWIPQPVSISIFYFPELCAVRAYTKQAVASGQHDQFPYSQHLLSKEDTNEEYMQSPVSLSLCRKEELLGEAQQPKYKFSFLSSWAGRAILGRFDSQRKLACPIPPTLGCRFILCGGGSHPTAPVSVAISGATHTVTQTGRIQTRNLVKTEFPNPPAFAL